MLLVNGYYFFPTKIVCTWQTRYQRKIGALDLQMKILSEIAGQLQLHLMGNMCFFSLVQIEKILTFVPLSREKNLIIPMISFNTMESVAFWRVKSSWQLWNRFLLSIRRWKKVQCCSWDWVRWNILTFPQRSFMDVRKHFICRLN